MPRRAGPTCRGNPLNQGHERADFSCGHRSLDDFLKKYAGQHARRKLGTTYVAVVLGHTRVLGYYTLAPSHLEFAHAPADLLKGPPKHPMPSLLLARLAMTQSERGQGLGRHLLLDAFDRCLRVARQVAFRAIEVEAIDDQAAAFYGKCGFLAFPSDRHHLAIGIATVEEVVSERRHPDRRRTSLPEGTGVFECHRSSARFFSAQSSDSCTSTHLLPQIPDFRA